MFSQVFLVLLFSFTNLSFFVCYFCVIIDGAIRCPRDWKESVIDATGGGCADS